MLGKAEPPAQPGSGFAFPAQQHPVHPAHPAHPAALGEQPGCSRGALQPLTSTGAPPAGPQGPQGENTLMGGMALRSHSHVLCHNSRKPGATRRWVDMGMPSVSGTLPLQVPQSPGPPSPPLTRPAARFWLIL